MRLRVITEEKEILHDEAESVTLPGRIGEVTILPGHAKLLSILSDGKIIYRTGGSAKELKIPGGVVEVVHDDITVLSR